MPLSTAPLPYSLPLAVVCQVVALVVRGGSHCADMGKPSPSDPPALASVKAAKRAWVRAVLGVDGPSPAAPHHLQHAHLSHDGPPPLPPSQECDHVRPLTDAPSPHDVLIVGAGYAGLAAAHSLVAAGLDVHILEVRAASLMGPHRLDGTPPPHGTQPA
jgi:hypothetical protein